jgi:dihydrofolate reductase
VYLNLVEGRLWVPDVAGSNPATPTRLSELFRKNNRSERGNNAPEADMKKVIVEAEVSLDGVMGGDNADFWKQIFAFHSADVQQYLDELLFTPEALLMGRETYQGFAQIWPTRKGKMADRINAMPKYVASRTLKAPLEWNAALIEGDVPGAIKTLKQEPGKALLQYGIGELTHTMLKHGLVDELRVLVFPFAFGQGPRVFERMGVQTLKLLDTKTFDSGVVALRYEPRG